MSKSNRKDQLPLSSRERVEKFDKLLYEIEAEVLEIDKFHNKLKATQKKVKELSDYYQTLWLEDFETFKDEKGLHVLGEDYAYNTFFEFREAQKKVLKLIVNNL